MPRSPNVIHHWIAWQHTAQAQQRSQLARLCALVGFSHDPPFIRRGERSPARLISHFRVRTLPFRFGPFARRSSRPTGSFRPARFLALVFKFRHQHTLSSFPPCSLIYEESGVSPTLAQRDSSLEEETKAYALFFLNVAYIDISKSGPNETSDFMLRRTQNAPPVDLQLALRHESKKIEERTTLMRKQDRHLRRLLKRGNALDMFIKNLYEQPVNAVVQQSLKAEKKAEKKKLGYVNAAES